MTIKLAGVNETVVNRAVPAQAVVAATETIVSGSQIALTAPLKVGSRFVWKLSITKTAAGTGDSSFLVKSNTTQTVATGTTGGAATLLTLAFNVAETAVAGSDIVEIEAIVQAISPTAGVAFGSLYAASTTAPTTGLANQSVGAVGSNLVTDSTIQSIGLAITSGAADAVTVNYCEASAVAI